MNKTNGYLMIDSIRNTIAGRQTVLAGAFLLVTPVIVNANQFALYTEPYRPGFHYSPELNWTNEPNGLVYKDGTYHMFYQANPFNNQFGNQSWGHATSTDLVHWEQRPIAIPADNGIMSFSGSAVHDVNNTSGLGTGGNGPLVAAYTGFIPTPSNIQDQRLAFSNDDGATWTKYSGNPVLSGLPFPESVETRDPKVFWHQPTNKWKMVLTHGGQQKASFWESSNMLSWSRTQDFFAPDIAAQIGGWEVPDFFKLPVKNAQGTVIDEKWVLSITPGSGSPAGGNGVMYFVGEYDGTTFTSENPLGTPLWADHGRDFDGQQSWNHAPNDRVIWTSIAQSYGESVPTNPWRGQMSLPRELSLVDYGSGPRLQQQPIAELQALRGQPTSLNNVLINPGADPLDSFNLQGDMFEIEAVFDPNGAVNLGLNIREGPGGQTVVGYLPSSGQMYVDRRFTGGLTSGVNAFNGNSAGIHFANVDLDSNGHIKLHAFLDRNSIELFGNNGQNVISDLIFPDDNSQGISLFASGGVANPAELVSLDIYPLSTIWQAGPQPLPGTSTIARWSMDALPQAEAIVPWSGPVSIDSRTRMGEGASLGSTNQSLEPDRAVENLWMVGETSMNTSSTVPPTSMFTLGNNGGSSSYDAEAIRFVDNRALHLPVDEYGDEVAFTDAFSIEMFFKTNGNQSGAGNMQLLLQGRDEFRYSIIVNEGGPGNVRFALNDKAGTIPVLDLNALNYADGNWHYLLATYDPTVGANGEMSLTIANENGTANTLSIDLATTFPGFDGLPADTDGDLLLGRHNVSLFSDPRTFLGLIDEVQITSGIVSDALRLGALPGDNFQLGDFDRDNDIDGDDLAIWQSFYGTPSDARLYEGDADLDMGVDAFDFLVWQRNFTGSLLVNSATSVPEPSSLVLLGLTVLLVDLRR